MTKFLTIPEELIGAADAAVDYFRNHGYKIKIEHRDLAYPYVPAFIAARTPTNLIVEIGSAVDVERMRQWLRYCRSCSRDTRIATCVRHEADVPASIQMILRREGIGLYYTNDDFMEILPPNDQALTLQLPDLQRFAAAVRDLLGPSYEKFERGDWRESFSDACQAMENEARAHLKRSLTSGRIKVLDKNGRPRKLTNAQIDRKTIGQLHHDFDQIQSPNYLDSQISKALAAINPDRVGVVHKKRRHRTEASLRRNVGHLMWTIINVLVEMKK
jgi:hypothetical protein